MFPRSGGEKVYLEAIYKRPKLLITTLFGINAVVLGFTASGKSVSYQMVSTEVRLRSLTM
jgi:hypothetical protein